MSILSGSKKMEMLAAVQGGVKEPARWSKSVQGVGAHAEGEVGRVVTGGVTDIPGATMLDKLHYLADVDD